MEPCRSIEEIAAELERGEPTLALTRHVEEEGCARCRTRLAAVRETLDLLAEARLEPVPAAVRAAARAVGRGMAAGASRGLVLGRLLERGRPALAFRGGGGAHVVYRAGDYEVDVALLESGAVIGQAWPAEDGVPPLGAGSCILYGESGSAESALSPDGEFRFPGAGRGPFDLVVEAEGASLMLPGVRLGS